MRLSTSTTCPVTSCTFTVRSTSTPRPDSSVEHAVVPRGRYPQLDAGTRVAAAVHRCVLVAGVAARLGRVPAGGGELGLDVRGPDGERRGPHQVAGGRRRLLRRARARAGRGGSGGGAAGGHGGGAAGARTGVVRAVDGAVRRPRWHGRLVGAGGTAASRAAAAGRGERGGEQQRAGRRPAYCRRAWPPGSAGSSPSRSGQSVHHRIPPRTRAVGTLTPVGRAVSCPGFGPVVPKGSRSELGPESETVGGMSQTQGSRTGGAAGSAGTRGGHRRRHLRTRRRPRPGAGRRPR